MAQLLLIGIKAAARAAQADTSLGRLVLQDMPERKLLLEAYATRKRAARSAALRDP